MSGKTIEAICSALSQPSNDQAEMLAECLRDAQQALQDAERFKGIGNAKVACMDAYGIIFKALAVYEQSKQGKA